LFLASALVQNTTECAQVVLAIEAGQSRAISPGIGAKDLEAMDNVSLRA
jgi:hypothetical protein